MRLLQKFRNKMLTRRWKFLEIETGILVESKASSAGVS